MRYPVTPTLSLEATQPKLICELEAVMAVRPVGAVGGVVSPPPLAARNAAICITHQLEGLCVEFAL